MGWLKDTFNPDPIECPRGWGPVTFTPTVLFVPPVFIVERSCPIGGVDKCQKCRYPIEPGSAEQLRLRLEELNGLRGSALNETEYRLRRRLLIQAREPSSFTPGDNEATTALILAPLGLVATGAGVYLSSTISLGFLAILMVGLVMLGLAGSFAGIAAMKRRSLPSDTHLLLEDPPMDARDLEAELSRAQEELGFYKELHKGQSTDPPGP